MKNDESKEFVVFKEEEYLNYKIKSPVTFPILDGLLPKMIVDFEYITLENVNVVTKNFWASH